MEFVVFTIAWICAGGNSIAGKKDLFDAENLKIVYDDAAEIGALDSASAQAMDDL